MIGFSKPRVRSTTPTCLARLDKVKQYRNSTVVTGDFQSRLGVIGPNRIMQPPGQRLSMYSPRSHILTVATDLPTSDLPHSVNTVQDIAGARGVNGFRPRNSFGALIVRQEHLNDADD